MEWRTRWTLFKWECWELLVTRFIWHHSVSVQCFIFDVMSLWYLQCNLFDHFTSLNIFSTKHVVFFLSAVLLDIGSANNIYIPEAAQKWLILLFSWKSTVIWYFWYFRKFSEGFLKVVTNKPGKNFFAIFLMSQNTYLFYEHVLIGPAPTSTIFWIAIQTTHNCISNYNRRIPAPLREISPPLVSAPFFAW